MNSDSSGSEDDATLKSTDAKDFTWSAGRDFSDDGFDSSNEKEDSNDEDFEDYSDQDSDEDSYEDSNESSNEDSTMSSDEEKKVILHYYQYVLTLLLDTNSNH